MFIRPSLKRGLAYAATTTAALALALPLAWTSSAAAALPELAAHNTTVTATTVAALPAPVPSIQPPSNPTVREAQQRLTWAGVYSGPINGVTSSATTTATKRFQAKYLLAADGVVGPKTLGKLRAITAKNSSAVDKRCLAKGRFLCADKTQRLMRHYLNGKLIGSTDVRFARPGYTTTNGAHKIYWKHIDHKSSLYNGAPMPYSMFFHKGEAVHYSPEFASRGYASPYGSHGCINVRDKTFARQLFAVTPINTVVVVYSSV